MALLPVWEACCVELWVGYRGGGLLCGNCAALPASWPSWVCEDFCVP